MNRDKKHFMGELWLSNGNSAQFTCYESVGGRVVLEVEGDDDSWQTTIVIDPKRHARHRGRSDRSNQIKAGKARSLPKANRKQSVSMPDVSTARGKVVQK